MRRAAARRAHVLVITSLSKFTLAFVPEATRVCDCYLKRKNHALVVIERTTKGIVDRRKASRNPLLLLAKERTRRSRRRHKIEWKIENQNTRCAKFTKRTRSRRDAPGLLLRLPESTQLATSGLLLLLLSKPSDHPTRRLTKQTSNTSLLIGRGTESSRTTRCDASSSSSSSERRRRRLPERGLRDVLRAPESSSAAERHLKCKRRNKAFKVCILFSNFLRYIQLVPLRSKENVSLFSKISLRSFLHMCETKIIHSRSETERERDTSCLASSSFEREEAAS